MRRFSWRDWFWDSVPQRKESHCILHVEQLEPREVLSFMVLPPEPSVPIETNENQPVAVPFRLFSFSSDAHTITITATNGTVVIDEALAAENNVAIDSNNSPTVTLVGILDNLNTVIGNGLFFNPTPFLSGDAAMTLTATAPPSFNNITDTGVQEIAVQPVVSAASMVVEASGVVFAPAAGFAFPPGFVRIAGWADADGSETITLDIFVSPAAGTNDTEFTLSANGTPIDPIEPNQWRLSGNNPTAFQALLDTLVLTPSSAQPFNGTIFVDFVGSLVDRAVFGPTGNRPDPLEVTTTPRSLGSAVVQVRFFLGGSVAVAPIVAPEGSAVDLGSGRLVASSPDEQPGDIHILSLTVPNGSLVFQSTAIPSGLMIDRSVASNGSTTLRLMGTIATINQFLAVPNSVTYTAAQPGFSGLVPLTVGLVNQPGSGANPITVSWPPNMGSGNTLTSGGSSPSPLDPTSGGSLLPNVPPSVPNSLDPPPRNATNPFTLVVAMQLTPVATPVVPSALDVVTTQDTPVGVFINLSPPSTDPSEKVEIRITGVPPGAAFNRGTNLGDGQWSFQPADLDDLLFIPPPGVTGTFPLVVTVLVTDTNLQLELTDTATHATNFTITVVPVPVTLGEPPPGPPPLPPPLFLPPDLGTSLSGIVLDNGRNDSRPPRTDPVVEGVVSANTARPETFLGYTGSSGESGLPLGQWPAVKLSVPSPESLFGHAEPAVPIYAGSEKHPLPPVLPLDQTLPVAGFTDAGGDSFTLVDMVYREAGMSRPVSVAPPPHAPGVSQPVSALVPSVPSRVAGSDTDHMTTQVAAAANIEEPSRWWSVGMGVLIIAGTIAAWGGLSARWGGAVGRTLRRLWTTLLRPSVKRTA
ncbi:MAG: hypothetical protein RMJ56_09755 [Gemmataceae bacterium]|nr:hypothetical protein [Gemmata sp.]MDW8197874.1 hypothetical protein [Gemmataceae bacterium]